jgi:hypothetical protein
MYVFFLSFIVKVNMDTNCHLSYEPIGCSTSIDKLDYVQPVQPPSPSASTTVTTTPSAPAVVEDEDNDSNVMPSYATHWPKKPATPPMPTYDLSPTPGLLDSSAGS